MRPAKNAKAKARPPVRVRHDPPTIEEAILAAQGLTDEIEHQIDIAAELMGVSREEANEALLKVTAEQKALAATSANRLTIAPRMQGLRAVPERTVVVERVRPRIARGPVVVEMRSFGRPRV